MTGRTRRTLGVLGLAIAVLAGLLIAGRDWWTIHTDGPAVTMSGTTSTGGLATGLALIVAGGIPLLLILRPIGRRIVAGAQLLAGVGMMLTGALPGEPGPELVRSQLRQHSLANATGVDVTGWPVGYLIAGVLAVVAAGIVLWSAATWPTRGDRFDRRRHDVTSDDPHEVWKALDAGVDPTAEDGAPSDDQPANPT